MIYSKDKKYCKEILNLLNKSGLAAVLAAGSWNDCAGWAQGTKESYVKTGKGSPRRRRGAQLEPDWGA